MPFKLKEPRVYDYYGGEYPVRHDPGAVAEIFKLTDWNINGKRYYVDPYVDDYVRECMDIGVRRGLYHFLRPGSTRDQALHYLEQVDQLGGVGEWGRAIVDVELDVSKMGIGGRDWAGQIKAWCDVVEGALGKKPMIYTGANYWQFASWIETRKVNGFNTRVRVYPEWCKDYPLWVASYPFSQFVDWNSRPISMPGGWGRDDWWLWQYSDKGRVNGYLANDLNVLSPKGIAGLGLAEVEDPGEEEPTGFPLTVRVTTAPYLRIRSGPGAEYSISGRIDFGKMVVIASSIKTTVGSDYEEWGKLDGGAGWIALRYNHVDKVEVLK